MHLVGHHPCPYSDHAEDRHADFDLDNQVRVLFEVVKDGAGNTEKMLNMASSHTRFLIAKVRALLFVLI